MVWCGNKSWVCRDAKKIAAIYWHFYTKIISVPDFSEDISTEFKKKVELSLATNRSKMDPTPALCALLLWTCRPVASRMPSFTVTDRCEKEAIRSSFQPGERKKEEGKSAENLQWSCLRVWELSQTTFTQHRYFGPFSLHLPTTCEKHISPAEVSVLQHPDRCLWTWQDVPCGF